MKKLAVLGLALLSVSVAKAQDAGGQRFGIKIGATYSSISGDDAKQLTGPDFNSEIGSYKLGYNIGIGTSFPISSDGFLSIAPELIYNRKGYEISSTRTVGNTETEIEQQRVLHYLDLPILARINAGGLFFEAGPQVSYLFGSKVKQQVTTKTGNNSNKVETDGKFQDYTGLSVDDASKSDLAQFDIAGVAGLGYMTEGGLSIGLRYARGFNSLIDSKDTKNEQKAFNNAFTLQLGYLLPFGK